MQKFNNNINYINPFLYSMYKKFCYIGPIGRFIINKQLNRLYNEKSEFITFLDLLYIFQTSFYLIPNKTQADLAYKKIVSFLDFIEKHIHLFFNNIYNSNVLIKVKSNKIKKKKFINFFFNSKNYKIISLTCDAALCSELKNINNFFQPYFFSLHINQLFLTSTLGQNIEQQNWLTELCQKRKISVLQFKERTKGIANPIREFTLNLLGRFCPLDSPEGLRSGAFITFPIDLKINKFKSIETQYLLIYNKTIYTKKRTLFFDIYQESNIFSILSDFKLTSTKKLKSNLILLNKKNSFYFQTNLDINFTKLMTFTKIFSINTNLIPFIENNDGNRILMSLNMQKQAIPLIYSYLPILSTGFNSHIATFANYNIKSYCEGEVIYVSTQQIQIKDYNNQIIIYTLNKNIKLHHNLLFTNNSLVWPGEHIFSGQIISENINSINGEICLGTNLLLAYSTWFSSTFEDAITLNERLLLTKRLASLHILEYEASFNITTNFFINQIETENLIQKDELYLDKLGIILPGTLVHTNSCLFSKYKVNQTKKMFFGEFFFKLFKRYIFDTFNINIFNNLLLKYYTSQMVNEKNYKKCSLKMCRPNFIGRVLRIYCRKLIQK